jgi:hypothetical protein
MSLPELLARHLAICDDLHRLCIEENRILKNEGCPPGEAWRERKRAVAVLLDESLSALRSRTVDPKEHGGEALEQARQRHLQILHLDRENEQLLLRCSLGAPRPPSVGGAPAAGALRAYGKKA